MGGGPVDAKRQPLLPLSLPTVLLAIPLGRALNRRLDAQRFRAYVHAALLASGAGLVFQAIVTWIAVGRRALSSPKEVGCHTMAKALSPTMTGARFQNGYRYLGGLPMNFAERIGIPAAKRLRKDELEKAIVAFLRTRKAALPTKRSLRMTGVKDVERGLNLRLRIENYTSNHETKDFIVEQARLMAPEVREKSGVWYRLNRWREERITSGEHPTYGGLVRRGTSP